MSQEGNKMLADMLRWSWDQIKNGNPEAKSVWGKTARDTMEACVRLIEESVNEPSDR